MESVISNTWRMLAHQPQCAKPPCGLDAIWHQTAGLARRLTQPPHRFLQQADVILDRERIYRHLADRRLRGLLARLRRRFQLRRDRQADRHLAIAVLREVAARTVGLRPYREQVAAALALDAGCVAEMATGEGKTLVAVMPAVLAGWRGRGCHVITAND